jgi:ParB-like chromosome segregation protein Spo0J
MHVKTLPLERLIPAPYNPRIELKKTDPRYRKLRRSIQDFGLVEPLVWNERTGHVVGGHQRLNILRELNAAEAEVSVVDLPPEREKTLNLILNNREAQGDWDAERLEALLTVLADEPEFDFRESGFGPEHLELLRERLKPAEPAANASGAEPGERVEVVLSMPAAAFENLRSELDQLVQRQGVECHVRWR